MKRLIDALLDAGTVGLGAAAPTSGLLKPLPLPPTAVDEGGGVGDAATVVMVKDTTMGDGLDR